MQRIVITFGLIAGAIEVAMMFITMPLYYSGALSLDHGAVVGYSTMLIAMSFTIFFGAKSYRDRHLNGVISFGTSMKIGLLITVIASIMYVVGWEICLKFFLPDFMQKYGEHIIRSAQQKGASAAEISDLTAKMASYAEVYKNPLLRMGMTFMELFPVGLVVAVVCSLIVRKKKTQLA